MRARAYLLLMLGFGIGCGSSEGASVAGLTAPVVYGADDRREVFAHPNEELRRIARESIVALIPTSRITRELSGEYSLRQSLLKDERNLCEDELFADQTVAASCSGVLIDDDLVLTAGHCIGGATPCSFFNYVFNYHLEGPDEPAVIRDEDVYSCARVLLDADSSQLTPDYAIIELDRPVEGLHAPALIRPASVVPEGEPVSMIGFGSGLPAKIDAGAAVADARAEFLDYFVVNLDAFEGHSGSATFDSDDRLAGILLGGRVPDYVPSPGESCSRVNVFQDQEAGELVHNIAPIIAAVCEEGLVGESICDPEACDGEPCGKHSVSSNGNPGSGPSGPVPTAGGSGCSAGVPRSDAPWLGFLLVFAAWRLRQRAA